MFVAQQFVEHVIGVGVWQCQRVGKHVRLVRVCDGRDWRQLHERRSVGDVWFGSGVLLMPNPGDTETFANCPCCGGSSSSSPSSASLSSSSGCYQCCDIDVACLNCVYAWGTLINGSQVGNAGCVTNAKNTITGTDSRGPLAFGNGPYRATRCNGWLSDVSCSVGGILFRNTITIVSNVMTCQVYCLAPFPGLCISSTNFFVGSATCTGSGTVIPMTWNAGGNCSGVTSFNMTFTW